jgi:hypothetical protein
VEAAALEAVLVSVAVDLASSSSSSSSSASPSSTWLERTLGRWCLLRLCGDGWSAEEAKEGAAGEGDALGAAEEDAVAGVADFDVEFDAAATTAAAAAVAAVAAVTPGTLSLANHSAAVAAAGVASLVRELRIVLPVLLEKNNPPFLLCERKEKKPSDLLSSPLFVPREREGSSPPVSLSPLSLSLALCPFSRRRERERERKQQHHEARPRRGALSAPRFRVCSRC